MILLTLANGDRIEIDVDDIDDIEPASTGAVVYCRDGAVLPVMQNARTLQTRVNTERFGRASKPKAPKKVQPKAAAMTGPSEATAAKPNTSFGSRTKRLLLGRSSIRAFIMGSNGTQTR